MCCVMTLPSYNTISLSFHFSPKPHKIRSHIILAHTQRERETDPAIEMTTPYLRTINRDILPKDLLPPRTTAAIERDRPPQDLKINPSHHLTLFRKAPHLLMDEECCQTLNSPFYVSGDTFSAR